MLIIIVLFWASCVFGLKERKKDCFGHEQKWSGLVVYCMFFWVVVRFLALVEQAFIDLLGDSRFLNKSKVVRGKTKEEKTQNHDIQRQEGYQLITLLGTQPNIAFLVEILMLGPPLQGIVLLI